MLLTFCSLLSRFLTFYPVQGITKKTITRWSFLLCNRDFVFWHSFSFAYKRKMGAQASEGIGELAHIDRAKLFLPAKSILSSDNYSSHDGLFCCATEILCFGTAFVCLMKNFKLVIIYKIALFLY